MTVLTGFRDLERVVGDLVGDLGTPGNQTPADLTDHLPFVRIQRIGGDGDQLTDRSRLTIDVYAASATAAKTTAETIRQRLLDAPYPIDRTVTEVGPHIITDADPAVHVVTATYRLSARR